MSVIKLSEEDNLIIQPFIIGNLLLELKGKDFLNSKYFTENFNDYFAEVLKKMTLDSQGIVIMLFYSFLVIPYEKLKSDVKTEYEKINNKIDEAIENKIFSIKNNYSDKDYLRHMRNSIAHVRFKFVSETSLTFIDKNDKKNYNFELTIPLNKLHYILFDLRNLTINYFNSNREKINND